MKKKKEGFIYKSVWTIEDWVSSLHHRLKGFFEKRTVTTQSTYSISVDSPATTKRSMKATYHQPGHVIWVLGCLISGFISFLTGLLIGLLI